MAGRQEKENLIKYKLWLHYKIFDQNHFENGESNIAQVPQDPKIYSQNFMVRQEILQLEEVQLLVLRQSMQIIDLSQRSLPDR